MSYTPTSWQNGDVITSAKLNKIENGIANAGGGTDILFATIDTSTRALDKTWQELVNAKVAYIRFNNGNGTLNMPVIYTEVVQNNEYVVASFGVAKITENDEQKLAPMLFTFVATSADGYPAFQM